MQNKSFEQTETQCPHRVPKKQPVSLIYGLLLLRGSRLSLCAASKLKSLSMACCCCGDLSFLCVQLLSQCVLGAAVKCVGCSTRKVLSFLNKSSFHFTQRNRILRIAKIKYFDCWCSLAVPPVWGITPLYASSSSRSNCTQQQLQRSSCAASGVQKEEPKRSWN